MPDTLNWIDVLLIFIVTPFSLNFVVDEASEEFGTVQKVPCPNPMLLILVELPIILHPTLLTGIEILKSENFILFRLIIVGQSIPMEHFILPFPNVCHVSVLLVQGSVSLNFAIFPAAFVISVVSGVMEFSLTVAEAVFYFAFVPCTIFISFRYLL